MKTYNHKRELSPGSRVYYNGFRCTVYAVYTSGVSFCMKGYPDIELDYIVPLHEIFDSIISINH